MPFSAVVIPSASGRDGGGEAGGPPSITSWVGGLTVISGAPETLEPVRLRLSRWHDGD